MMKKAIILSALALMGFSCQAAELSEREQLALQNVKRSVVLLDNTVSRYFDAGTKAIAMDYDPAKKQRIGEVSVWEYTTALEMVNSVLEGLEAVKNLDRNFYHRHHDRMVRLFATFYEGMQNYHGSFTLPSYTGENRWKVYTVNKHADPAADHYKANVYDDQMWIIRELLRAWRLTGNKAYFDDARHLTTYVLDGWDPTLDKKGNEYGGITWGPGYTSKHACSNAPFISPLAWMAEETKGDGDVEYYVLNRKGTRVARTQEPYSYYLGYAKKTFKWQADSLYDQQTGLFWDMRGGLTDWHTETVDGVKYRRHVNLGRPVGTFYTYNIGTMISGGADLYRLTGDASYKKMIEKYIEDATSRLTFTKRIGGKDYHGYMAAYGKEVIGRAWFNDVLIRGLIDANLVDGSLGVRGIEYAQENLDYAYENNLVDGLLPNQLIVAGSEVIPFQQEASFISIYAQLAKYQASPHPSPTGEGVQTN